MAKVDFKLKTKIYEHLRTVGDKLENGFYVYHEGHSDSSVAKLFDVSVAVVSGVRATTFGKLRSARKASIEDRLRAVETYLDELAPGWRQRILALEV